LNVSNENENIFNVFANIVRTMPANACESYEQPLPLASFQIFCNVMQSSAIVDGFFFSLW